MCMCICVCVFVFVDVKEKQFFMFCLAMTTINHVLSLKCMHDGVSCRLPSLLSFFLFVSQCMYLSVSFASFYLFLWLLRWFFVCVCAWGRTIVDFSLVFFFVVFFIAFLVNNFFFVLFVVVIVALQFLF